MLLEPWGNRLVTQAGRPNFEEATHLFHGESAFGAMKGARWYVAPDSLEVGPSAADPEQHSRVRMRFWRGAYRALGLALPPKGDVHSARDVKRVVGTRQSPVVVWTGIDLGGTLFLWWALDALLPTGREVWLARPADDSTLQTILVHTREELTELFVSAPRLRRSEIVAASRLWRAFASGRLQALQQRARPSGQPAWMIPPQTLTLLFPRTIGAKLLLSRFDEALLGGFNDWCTTAETVSKETVDVLFAFGDYFQELRAEQWARFVPTPGLEQRETGGRGPLTRYAFRLTPHGQRLLDQGLETTGNAPEVEVGGAVAYARKRPWLVAESNEAWRLYRSPR